MIYPNLGYVGNPPIKHNVKDTGIHRVDREVWHLCFEEVWKIGCGIGFCVFILPTTTPFRRLALCKLNRSPASSDELLRHSRSSLAIRS